MTRKLNVAGVVNSVTTLIGSTIKNILLAFVIGCLALLAIILGFIAFLAQLVR